MIVTLEMRVAVRCKACSVLTPMVGIRSTVSCRNCAAEMDFAKRALDARDGGVRYPFGGYYDALAEAALVLGDGDDCRDARDSSGSPVELRRVAGPACLSCERRLAIPDAGATTIACAGCGDVAGVRWPDKETRSWDPRITCIVGDGLRPQAQTREARTQGTLISCGQCGAPLSGDQKDRRRARTCTHCSAVNFLGDAAILALFPQPEWHRSFLVYDVSDELRRSLYERLVGGDTSYGLDADVKARLVAEHEAGLAAERSAAITSASPEAAARFAFDASLTAAEAAAIDARFDDVQRTQLADCAVVPLARRWVTSANAAVREAVAKNRALGASELVTLARDSDARVRAAAAARSELPKDALAKLRKDSDPAVVSAVKANPSLPRGLFGKLFG